MKPSEALRLHKKEIRRMVEKYHARNPRVFGSVLHGDDREDSDLDLLVDPTSETSLLDIAKLQNRLQALLGIKVDVLTPRSLSPRYRDEIVREAKAL